MDDVIDRLAPEHAVAASELAFRSKAHWGYDDAFMQTCRAELTYSPAQLDEHEFIALWRDRQLCGFYALEAIDARQIELEAMFIEPSCIGLGIGRRLFNDATQRAARAGHDEMVIQSDPYAAGFYRGMGARDVGTRESQSVPGRLLPLLVFDITAAPSKRGENS